MKIGNTTNPVSTTTVNGDRPTAARPQESSSTTVSLTRQDSSTQVELSPEATMLSQAGDDPSFDSAKVERIAQAIRDGRFSIDPGAIADKLIANSQELLSRAQTSH